MNVPALRFPEFAGDWEEKQLDAITDKKISYGIVQAGPHVPEGMPYIKSKDLNGPLTLSELERTSDVIAKSYRRSEVRPGDIVFSLRGNIGVSQIVPDTISVANLTQGTARISVKRSSVNTFVFRALETPRIKKRIFAVMKGSTFQEISLGDLRQIKVSAPSLPEQKKIASFLGAVDAKIAALRDRQAGLERYKRGLMQALFSQRLRFTKPDGTAFPDWEETTIGGIGSFYYGKSAPKFSLSEDAPTPCVRYGELYSHYSLVIGAIKSKTNIAPENLKFSKGMEILVPRVGEDPLDFSMCCLLPHAGVAIGEMISVFETDQNQLFYTYYFRTLKYEFAKMVEGGSVSNLYFRYLEPIKIGKPHPDEQARIAEALSAMDAKITAVTKQLDRMQDFKKGLLQQMFI